MNNLLKEYFIFSKNQTTGILILVTGIVICIFLYFLLPPFFYKKNIPPHDSSLRQMMTQIKIDESKNAYSNNNYSNSTSSLTPFNFNPNTLDSLGFIKLGLREKLVHTIINYRNKGGKYYNKEGFKKMYGLHVEEYNQLASYINIPETNNYNQKKKETISIELNSADTSALVKLRGIGSKLAMNIVKYRSDLGGFVNVSQLKEVYGISDETFEMIKPDVWIKNKLIKKINLNVATYNEINTHPYLHGELSKAIVEFRKQKKYHIESLNQLKEIEIITEEIFRKIAPYLSVE